MTFAAFLSSCDTYKTIPLPPTFKPDPVTIVKIPCVSKDQAWDRAARLFADRNISIKTIDKSSGFIQSNVLSFISAYQIDGENSPKYPPYVIEERNQERKIDGGMVIQPLYVTGSLKIFMLNDSNQIEIRVNIEDLRINGKASQYYSSVNITEMHYRAFSTGKLESEIADYISTGKDSANTIRIQNGVVPNPYYSR